MCLVDKREVCSLHKKPFADKVHIDLSTWKSSVYMHCTLTHLTAPLHSLNQKKERKSTHNTSHSILYSSTIQRESTNHDERSQQKGRKNLNVYSGGILRKGTYFLNRNLYYFASCLVLLRFHIRPTIEKKPPWNIKQLKNIHSIMMSDEGWEKMYAWFINSLYRFSMHTTHKII